jgi:cysteine desulfurase
MENTEKVVYLDNAATTACAPEALAVMVERRLRQPQQPL